MALILGTYGFSPYERKLIQEQLKVIDSKVACQWMYAGETTEAALLLAKKPCHKGTQAVQVRLYKPVDKNSESRQTHYIDAEWPLRIFGLLDIVQQTEKIINNNSATQSGTATTNETAALIKKLTALKSGNAIYQLNNQLLAALTEENRRTFIYSRLPVSALGDALRKNKHIEIGNAVDNATQLPHKYPLIALLWDLELEADVPASDLSQWEQRRYSLGQWPDFKWLRTGDNVLRLSAAFTKRPLSIQEAATLLKIEPGAVIRFLKACTTVGLRITDTRIRGAQARLAASPNEQQGKQLSLLSSLRKRLKMAFS